MDEKIRAEQALQIGLVTAVHPAEELEERVCAVAARLAAAAPLARCGMKANLNEAATTSLAEALAQESPRHVACAYSEDAAEAGKAFLERRTPVFVGR
jgi:2-(1,2-epoxy-1,2-dihydrophenyl)acetyl-CoA isomerase